MFRWGTLTSDRPPRIKQAHSENSYFPEEVIASYSTTAGYAFQQESVTHFHGYPQ